ncbi:MAG: AAA family ATPase [Myxococcota bacterium]
MLHVQLMATPRILLNGEPLSRLNTYYFEALLAGVLLEPGRTVSREELGLRFWRTHDEVCRRTNLRQLLTRFKRVWPEGEQFINLGREVAAWRSEQPLSLDVERIELLLAQPPTREILKELVGLYRGPLLAAHTERWVVSRRLRLEQACIRYCRGATSRAEALRDHSLLIQSIEALVHIQPGVEDHWTELARAHNLAGSHHRLEETAEQYVFARESIGQAPRKETLSRLSPLRPSVRTTPGPSQSIFGRDVEWHTLLELWTGARSGASSVALVSGSTGMGKSTLLEEFGQHVRGDDCVVLQVQCFPSTASCPYLGIAKLARQLASMERADGTRSDATDRWIAAAAASGTSLQTGSGPLSGGGLQLGRIALLQKLRADLTSVRPVLILVDDLHWCDRESLELLTVLLQEGSTEGLMLVISMNLQGLCGENPLGPRLQTELARGCHFAQLELRPLLPEASLELILSRMVTPVAQASLDALVEQSEGIPLLLLERFRVKEQVGGSTGPLTVSFRERLLGLFARCSPGARALAQHCAVVGRHIVPHDHVLFRDEAADLLAALDELLANGFLREREDGVLEWPFEAQRKVILETLSVFRRHALERKAAACTVALEPLATRPLSAL